METAGTALAVLVWGGFFGTLLVGVAATVLTVRWRRRSIAAMERAERAQCPERTGRPPQGPARQGLPGAPEGRRGAGGAG
ncbi:hypothetical protein [Streptomyces sp. NPDC014894]|uniref:hypothetical protein n=1 Tax=unclassified Streptomyces TaxID=2593676 RepID=UPI00370243DC